MDEEIFMHIDFGSGKKLCIRTKCIESLFYNPECFVEGKFQAVVEVRMSSGQKDIIHINDADGTYLVYQELVEKLELNNR